MNAVRGQIRSRLITEPGDGGFRARFALDPDFVLLPDHFASQPVFPGICLLQAVLLSGAAARGLPNLHLCRLKNLKLLQPLRPGDQINIDAQMAGDDHGELSIKARVFVADQKCAEFSLVARYAPAGAGAPA